MSRTLNRWDYRIEFTDGANQSYRLAVTDLAFRYFLDYRRTHDNLLPNAIAQIMTDSLQHATVFLRIGLTRGGYNPERCHLQITGVYSFPDYLDGRCFADFAPAPDVSVRPVSDDEMPF